MARPFEKIGLIGTADGGRRTAVGPGRFRCPAYFGDDADAHDCMLVVPEDTALAPGGPAKVLEVRFLVPELLRGRIAPGVTFRLWEGRTIGHGVFVREGLE